jgi:hypothetical protein
MPTHQSAVSLANAAPVIAIALFVGMLALIETGRRIGKQRAAKDTEGARAGLGAVEGAVFALMGLLIAFTFSGAATRFDGRRHLVAQEANAIGTAWLRIDVLPTNGQAVVRELFRQYVDSRLAVYRALPDLEAVRTELARSAQLQAEIWTRAVEQCQTPEGQRVTMLLLPALNEMFDITTTRTMAAQAHPPTIVFAMLIVLALASALLAGYGMAGGRTRSWIHMIGFAAIMAVTVYVILDIEYPRLGLIRVDTADQLLVDLREGMK